MFDSAGYRASSALQSFDKYLTLLLFVLRTTSNKYIVSNGAISEFVRNFDLIIRQN